MPLFVNQPVANSTQQGPRADESRIKVTLAWFGGRWSLPDLKVVG